MPKLVKARGVSYHEMELVRPWKIHYNVCCKGQSLKEAVYDEIYDEMNILCASCKRCIRQHGNCRSLQEMVEDWGYKIFRSYIDFNG